MRRPAPAPTGCVTPLNSPHRPEPWLPHLESGSNERGHSPSAGPGAPPKAGRQVKATEREGRGRSYFNVSERPWLCDSMKHNFILRFRMFSVFTAAAEETMGSPEALSYPKLASPLRDCPETSSKSAQSLTQGQPSAPHAGRPGGRCSRGKRGQALGLASHGLCGLRQVTSPLCSTLSSPVK